MMQVNSVDMDSVQVTPRKLDNNLVAHELHTAAAEGLSQLLANPSSKQMELPLPGLSNVSSPTASTPESALAPQK